MTTSSSIPLTFLDTETTHLSTEVGEVWEVAIILRDRTGENEHVWQFRPDIVRASPEALRIGRYDERFSVPEGHDAAYIDPHGVPYPRLRAEAIQKISAILQGAVLVANNAAFDDRHLRKLLNLQEEEQPWFYRPRCVTAMAEGYLRRADPAWMAEQEAKGPISSRTLSRRLGVEPPGADAHQALADARWVAAMHDAITSHGTVSG
jgi:hypothetical protein